MLLVAPAPVEKPSYATSAAVAPAPAPSYATSTAQQQVIDLNALLATTAVQGPAVTGGTQQQYLHYSKQVESNFPTKGWNRLRKPVDLLSSR